MEEKVIESVLVFAAKKLLDRDKCRRCCRTRADELEKELAVLEAEFNTTKSRYLQAIQALRGK